MTCLQRLSCVELAQQYQTYRNKDALKELGRRDKIILLFSLPGQLLFPFGEELDVSDGSSVKFIGESYDAGYCAGLKAKSKELAGFHRAAEQAGEMLTYRHDRPVITRAMREYLTCPFPHSEPEL